MKARRISPSIQACALIIALAFALASGANVAAARAPQNRRVAERNGALPTLTLNLDDFGAVGDGATDDGPALQSALDALAVAGGGTLLVPHGRYAIITPVSADFTDRNASVIIQGVESSTPVPPPTADGNELTHGLDLVSEFAPKTGEERAALSVWGLRSFLIKDIAFVGTPDVSTDALTTLAISDIEEAIVRHCEFYGLISLVGSGSVVQATRSRLSIEQSVFLGCTADSGIYGSVVQNLEWKRIAVEDCVFADYGQRAELFSKTGYGSPLSWVNVGNAAATTNDSPRREVVLRNLFLDEGGYFAISALPDRFQPPQSAPVDLVYVTGLFVNVSNLGATGNHLAGLRHVMIEDSHYGWSHLADSAIHLLDVGSAIIDRAECVDDATRISADSATGSLTVIDSLYKTLDSEARETKVITTNAPDDDPVQYVRRQFQDVAGRAPDAAGHFYWSDKILRCGDDAQCVADQRAALAAYLALSPSPTFSVAGVVTNENNKPLPGTSVSLSGSQSATTETDDAGRYHFSNLPTSGVYTVAVSKRHYGFGTPAQTFDAPPGDRTANFSATLNRHAISGRLSDGGGSALPGATVTLSGAYDASTTTDAAGIFSFTDIPAGGDYAVTPSSARYTFAPESQSFVDLDGDESANFGGTALFQSISGQIINSTGHALQGVTVTLSGSRAGTTTTDAGGNFSFADLPRGSSYTVTPSSPDHLFAPASKTFDDISADQSPVFVGTFTTYRISGRVADKGVGVGGVSVALSGSQSATATTDAVGNYSFPNVPMGGNYTITASKPHYAFAPASATFSILAADQTATFDATLNRHKIEGRVTKDGLAMQGVALALSGSQSAATTTDAAGIFSFDGLVAGGHYVVTPSLKNHAFAPASQTFDDLGGDKSALFAATLDRYKLSGRVTEKGAGLGGVVVSLSGSQTATATTDADGNYVFANLAAGGDYALALSKKNYSFAPAGATFKGLGGDGVTDFVATLQTVVEFGAASFDASEDAGSFQIMLTRAGDTSTRAVVVYSAQDGTARQGNDLSTVVGLVAFEPDETTKNITLFITNDSFVEGAESITLTLQAVGATVIGERATASLTISDNDSDAAAANAIDDARFFVRQHYRDFLNREPDSAGLEFWAGQIVACGADSACLSVRRQNVSAAFFLSIEFKETGYLIYRLYKASYGRMPRRAEEFLFDSRIIGDGVIVGAPGWEQKIAANRSDFLAQFVAREAFRARYPSSLTPAQFVAALDANAGGSLSADETSDAVAEFAGAPDSSDAAARQRALLRVAESRAFYDRELNPAFVLMQYFGYLQRNPDEAPNTNLDGYNFWLKKLEDFKGDFRRAEMVRAFIESNEYRSRFGK